MELNRRWDPLVLCLISCLLQGSSGDVALTANRRTQGLQSDIRIVSTVSRTSLSLHLTQAVISGRREFCCCGRVSSLRRQSRRPTLWWYHHSFRYRPDSCTLVGFCFTESFPNLTLAPQRWSVPSRSFSRWSDHRWERCHWAFRGRSRVSSP